MSGLPETPWRGPATPPGTPVIRSSARHGSP